MPIVVTGFRSDAGKLNLSADWEFVSPEGKVLAAAKKCCTATQAAAGTPGLVVLNPVMDLIFDLTDVSGTYTVRAKVSDGTATATASASFAVENSVEPKKPAVQKVGSGGTAPQRTARAGADARHCLEFEANRKVMVCAEKYR